MENDDGDDDGDILAGSDFVFGQDDIDDDGMLDLNGDINVLAQQENSKRQRNNAKAVECMDLSGTVIATYRSGLEAVQALGVAQGDISLCCRGMKDSVGAYRFRFVGGDEKSKYRREDEESSRFMTRLTRHRTETNYDPRIQTMGSVLAPPEIKVRRTVTFICIYLIQIVYAITKCVSC